MVAWEQIVEQVDRVPAAVPRSMIGVNSPVIVSLARSISCLLYFKSRCGRSSPWASGRR